MQQNLAEKYGMLYDYMAESKKPENMKAFGKVMTQMMNDMIASNPAKAEEYINRLESIRWRNYLTPAEAEKAVSEMSPKAPWTKDTWEAAMKQHGYETEEHPYYNKCALWAVMNMIMSDSSKSIEKFAGADKAFDFVYSLALDKLKDEDMKFNVRKYLL